MLRYALTILIISFCSVALVFADETESSVEYDPSVCAGSVDAEDVIASAVEAAASDACLAMMEAFPYPDTAQDYS